MEIVRHQNINMEYKAGYTIRNVIEKNNIAVKLISISNKYGKMEPISHMEAMIVVLHSSGGQIFWGDSRENLDKSHVLDTGMTLHISNNEWFAFQSELEGILELVMIYYSNKK